MKLLSKRAAVLLILSSLLIWGLLIFTIKYFNNAAAWVQHPSNRHLYTNGQLISSGKVYDRAGNILLQIIDGKTKFNEDKAVRTAVMHAIGDRDGNVETGVQVAFSNRLSGWDIINGTYCFYDRAGFSGELDLTLDTALCVTAYRELNGHKGAVGIYNYRTGEILCMVSSPSFDPQNPPQIKVGPEKYEGVYINRFLSAAYTPGSIFKLVTTAAALENLSNMKDKLYHCEGKYQIDGDEITCLSTHGQVTLEQALAHSCNVVFAQITLELGAKVLQRYADLVGFNFGLDVDGIRTAAGKVDVKDAEGADLAWAGIGQYTNTANPLNFMAYLGAIANDGVRVTPRILARQGTLSAVTALLSAKKRLISKETAQKLGEMMRNNTISVYGEHNFNNLELCAKSGTAEVGAGRKPHAWFAGFLRRDDFPLAFVVIIENGGTGSGVAAPIAAKVLQAAVSAGSRPQG